MKTPDQSLSEPATVLPEGSRGRGRWARWSCELAALLLTLALRGEPAPQAPHSNSASHQEMRKAVPWTSLGLSGGGGMFTPAISPADPNLLLVNCDMSGIYRSTDGGQNWEMIHYLQLTSSTRVRPVWHSSDANIAYAAGGSSGPLKMTQDRGRTWIPVAGGPTGVSASGIDPAHPEVRLVCGRGGLYLPR